MIASKDTKTNQNAVKIYVIGTLKRLEKKPLKNYYWLCDWLKTFEKQQEKDVKKLGPLIG